MTVLDACHHVHAGCACADAAVLASLVRTRPVAAGPRRPLSPPPMRAGAADHVIVGRIRTMDPARPDAEAIAVRDGRIIGIGSRADVDGLTGPGTSTLDLDDGVAYPGFVEPHMHYWASAMLEGWVDCSPLEGAGFDRIVDGLRTAPPTRGGWTLGRGFDPSLIAGERELGRDVLDVAVPDRPVLVMNASLHYAYLNSRALELAGIDEDTPDPDGGFFAREDGRLTGALGELAAIGRGLAAVPPMDQAELLDAVVAVSRRAAGRGVTRTHDAATGMVVGPAEPDLLHGLSERLATRAGYAIYDEAADALLADGLEAGAGDDMVRAVSWKLISDGSNQGRSGYQHDNYLDRDFRGAPNIGVDHMAERIALAHRHGWQVMIHANGDAAIEMVIDAYQRGLGDVSGRVHRDRIEHCSLPTAVDLARMAHLGVSPSFLMNHVYYWGRALAEDIIGEERARRLDPVASALGHGLRPSLHSDYTVTEVDPLRAVQTAVTRRVRDGGAVLNPDERVGVDAAVRAVTVDAAWQVHADGAGGTLEVGKYADIALLDADPRDIDPEGIAEIGVAATLLGGVPVPGG